MGDRVFLAYKKDEKEKHKNLMEITAMSDKNILMRCYESFNGIYYNNYSSFKDAVVCLNGGQCTGEIVSADGLVLTNHHCGYDNIAEHSTVENNILKNGFFLQNQGLKNW